MSPRERFNFLPEAEQHKKTVHLGPTQVALDYAMLQLLEEIPKFVSAEESAAAANRLAGARQFRTVFENLCPVEDQPKPKPGFNHRDP